jgi:hypothetical protein
VWLSRTSLCIALLSSTLGACHHRALTNDEDAAPPDATHVGGDFGRLIAYCTNDGGACPDDLCVFGCCPGGSNNPGAGCAGCCQPKPCSAIPAAQCPNDACQIMIDCAGNRACTYQFSASPPACGSLSYYGQDVDCCPGLVKRCGQAQADGSCDPAAGGYNSFPWCLPCGDGVCDSTYENPCSCPEDCKP